MDQNINHFGGYLEESEHKSLAELEILVLVSFICLLVCFWNCHRLHCYELESEALDNVLSTFLQRPVKRVINTTLSVFCSLIAWPVCLHWYFSLLTWVDMLYHCLLWGEDNTLWLHWMRVEKFRNNDDCSGQNSEVAKVHF